MWIDVDAHIFPKEVLDGVPKFKNGLSLFVDPPEKNDLSDFKGRCAYLVGNIYD
tara:strand:+ start:331 stop:492 length:162 start_codon:yes stop_codon:yes gene_type:complete